VAAAAATTAAEVAMAASRACEQVLLPIVQVIEAMVALAVQQHQGVEKATKEAAAAAVSHRLVS
jgi:hypothetical protein